MKLYDLKTLHMEQPVIDKTPCFSWKICSSRPNVIQEKYRIIVKRGEDFLWDTGEVFSREQSFIEYKGSPLSSETRYQWTVTVWDSHGQSASAKAVFETAFFRQADWKAKWIECSFERKNACGQNFGNSYPPVLFEKEFLLEKRVKSARIYASAHGVYRLTLNKKRPDQREFAPEFTPYGKCLYYQVYDVKELLTEGRNVLQMYVEDGWYFSSQAGPVMQDRHKEPSVVIQMELTYEDETSEMILSDGSETCRTDFIVYSDLYQGEKQDLTLASGEKKPVMIKDYGYDFLHVQPMEPILPIREIPAVEVFTSPAGETIVDFGQVLAGRARIKIDVPKGQTVSLDYFEILDEKGNYIDTMFAPQKDIVISAGDPFVHEALFTFHGFRYIRVTGIEDVRKEDFTAVLLSTAKENAGTFACSDARLNRLYQNVRWSQYSNMMSVPTDCPSREKGGYTGDLLIYAKTALKNEKLTPFLKSWLNSVRLDQAGDGVVMIVSPYMKLYENLMKDASARCGEDTISGVAGWSDAIVWIPYEMYQVTGDRLVLKENYEAMEKWCEYIIHAAEKQSTLDIPEQYDRYLWNTGFHFGEWLVPGREDHTGEPFGICRETAYYIAPFFGYVTIKKMTEICEVLGKKDKAKDYGNIAAKMKTSIQEGIMRRNLMPDDLMGAYVLAFAFGLVPEDLCDAYKEKFLSLLEKSGRCIGTGFLATPFILDVLCDLGETETAHQILWQEKRPSWLYEVYHGATTIWESWDADDAARGGRYVSFNHYAFGCVDDWICRHIAGIDSDTPGYSHIVIRPDMDSHLSWCRRTFECEAGEISVYWDKEKLSVSIPANTTATVYWNNQVYDVGSGSYEWTERSI